MRLGLLPAGFAEKLKGKKVIWLHAVSAGEVVAAGSLIERLHQLYPEYRIVISTVTPAGNRIAARFAPDAGLLIYLPLDLSPITSRVVGAINPKIFIALETEIWPALFRALSRRHIPILIVNGRISRRSLRRYLIVRPLLDIVLSYVDMFCMQTEKDKERILKLGADADRVLVTGNMKYDIEPKMKEDAALEDIRKSIGAENKVFLAGSTHPPEEEILLAAHKRLRENFPHLRLIIAPRHIERAGEIKGLISRLGLVGEVTVIDKMGILNTAYALADIVFIGGSLIPHGGQSPIEPARCAKPVMFGAFMFNFEDARDALLEAGGAVEVKDVDEICSCALRLLGNPDEARAMGERAKAAMENKRGATARNIEILGTLFSRVKN